MLLIVIQNLILALMALSVLGLLTLIGMVSPKTRSAVWGNPVAVLGR